MSRLFSLLCMLDTNKLINHVRLYWYTGSMLARSEMQKNRIWLEYAIGVYPRRTFEEVIPFKSKGQKGRGCGI